MFEVIRGEDIIALIRAPDILSAYRRMLAEFGEAILVERYPDDLLP